MKRIFLFAFICTTLQLSAQNLQFQWVKNVLNPKRMVVDQNDNVYISGKYSGTISSHGINLTFASTDGSYNSFFAKLDSSGNVLWYRQLAGTFTEDITDLNVDSDGNLIISAMFVDRVLVGGDTLIGTYWAHNTLLMKYLANGDLDWYTVPVTIDTGCVHIYKTVLDNDNNIYFTGTGDDHNMHFDTTILNGDSTYGYIAKYSPSGEFIWVNGMNSEVFQMGVGPTGNIVFYRNDSLIKLSTAGNEIWAQPVPYKLNQVDDHTLLVIDRFDNLYAAGFYYSTITLGTDSFTSVGASDIIIEKLNANGSHLWAYSIGGPDSDQPSMLSVNLDRVVLAGDFREKIYIENDSIVSPWSLPFYYPSTCIIGLNLSGIRQFDNAIFARQYSNNALITMNDAIYVSVLAADSAFFDGEIFYSDSGYYPTFLAKLHGTTASIEQIGSGIAVYPNPASDYVEIHVAVIGQNTLAEIVNTEGRILKTVKLENAREIIDIRFLNSGIYFLRITDPEFSSVHRILKI